MAHIPAEGCPSIVELRAQDVGELSLRGMTERLDLPMSGARRFLAVLIEQGWVERDLPTSLNRQGAGRGSDADCPVLVAALLVGLVLIA